MNKVQSKEVWGSTATVEQIAGRLRGLGRVAILTHSKPDGDAVGSTLAVARALKKIGVEAWPVYLGLWSRRFDAVVGETPVVHEKHGVFAHAPLSEIPDSLILDTGSWNQLADAKDWLKQRHAGAMVIDHHSHGDPDVAPVRYVETSAAAACQIAARLCVSLLGVRSPGALPTDVAEPLLLGLATDTGWFRHSNTTAGVMRLAGELIEAGARHNWLYQTVEQGDEPSRLKLIGCALSSLEYLAGSRAALMHVTKADIERSGATLDDTGGLTDLPQTVGTVRVAAVLVELEPALTKLSLRSKADGELDVDVNLLAQKLNGGGHKHAAGAKLHVPMSEALPRVRALLEGALK